jgi:hypothetical protein
LSTLWLRVVVAVVVMVAVAVLEDLEPVLVYL